MIGREIDPNQHSPYKTPFKLIISFFQIYFDGYVAHFPLFPTNSMNNLLHYNSIINLFSARNKGYLQQRYKLPQVRFQPGYNYFCYYLVDCVT